MNPSVSSWFVRGCAAEKSLGPNCGRCGALRTIWPGDAPSLRAAESLAPSGDLDLLRLRCGGASDRVTLELGIMARLRWIAHRAPLACRNFI